MTEKQAIKILKEEKSWESDDRKIDAFIMGIEALEEIQQYRAIGTVEEIKEVLSVADIQADKLNAYKQLGTIEEFKALKEKNTPYKPKEYEDRYYACKCGNPLLHKWDEYPTKLMPKTRGLSYCLNCGQKLDWSE